MKKISYFILTFALCTAGIGTAARFAPAHHASPSDSMTAVNDTIYPDDEELYDEDEFDEEGFGEADFENESHL